MQTGNKNESGSDSKPEEGQVNINQISKTENKLKREPSTPQITEDSTKNSNRVSSRKMQRDMKEIKEISKPIRNMKVMEISRVNSVLPDKYQLGLQPIRKKEGSESVMSRNLSTILKVSKEAQTDYMEEKEEKVF